MHDSSTASLSHPSLATLHERDASRPLWERILAHPPGDVAYSERTTGRRITYGGLIGAVHATAVDVPVETLAVGNRIEFVVRFLAAMRAGRAVLPLDTTVPNAERQRLQTLAAEDDSVGAAVLLGSSGTTGAPKLIRRERAALDAVARMMADAIGLRRDDRVLAAVPLAHSYGLEHGLLAPLWAGSTVLLCDGFDLPPVAAAWHDATVVPAVPSMAELLLRSEIAASETLRRFYTAGAPLPAAIAAAFAARYGVRVGQVYGMTEIGSVVVHDPSRDTPGTVGRAVDGVSLRIDPDGELLVRSPCMLSRYLGDDLQLNDGHFATGDLATLGVHGELTLTGRRRLLIDVGGAKVNPAEVEAVLMSHPAVAVAVVLPLNLSSTVRKVRAVVVPASPADPPSARALRDFVRERLARHKVPRVIEFRADVPRTSAGKIARQLLETP